MNIGMDVGFHQLKAVCQDRSSIIPSFVAPYQVARMSMNHSDSIAIDSTHGHFLIGDQALRLGQGVRQESAEWLGSPEWMSLFYAGLSRLTNSNSFDARVVIGLPIVDYDRQKKFIAHKLKGFHLFKRNTLPQQKCHVKDVRVVPQAWGAIFDELLNMNGETVNAEISEQRVAVIDIGGHTVNYLAVDGLSDIPVESRGTERGAWNVVRTIREYLSQHHPDLSRHKGHTLMKAAIDGYIYAGADKISLTPIVQPIIDEIGQEIVRTARQHWGQRASMYRQVLIIGGGAHIWTGHIQQAFSHARMLKEPVMVNARGFAKFAEYLGE